MLPVKVVDFVQDNWVNRCSSYEDTWVSIHGYGINSLAAGRCSCNLELIIFKLMSRIDILSISHETAPMITTENLPDVKSII